MQQRKKLEGDLVKSNSCEFDAFLLKCCNILCAISKFGNILVENLNIKHFNYYTIVTLKSWRIQRLNSSLLVNNVEHLKSQFFHKLENFQHRMICRQYGVQPSPNGHKSL